LKLTFRQNRPGINDSLIRRTVWLDGNEDHRIIVDVEECRREADVDEALEVATQEAGVRFRPGPASLGGRSLANPDPETSSIYVARANVLIWGVSAGCQRFELDPLLRVIVEELDIERPGPVEDLKFTRERDRDGAICLAYDSRWTRGESAWMKFTADNATLARAPEPGRLLAWPTRGADSPFTITAWVIEPGRQTYGGRYRHS
jgi:hypothetical protein